MQVALLAGVALATYFLRAVIIVTDFSRRRSFPGTLADSPPLPGMAPQQSYLDEQEVTKSPEDSVPLGWIRIVLQEVARLYQEEISEGDRKGEGEGEGEGDAGVGVLSSCRSHVWGCLSSQAELGLEALHTHRDLIRWTKYFTYRIM